jgi:hypothetical protein
MRARERKIDGLREREKKRVVDNKSERKYFP